MASSAQADIIQDYGGTLQAGSDVQKPEKLEITFKKLPNGDRDNSINVSCVFPPLSILLTAYHSDSFAQ